MRRPLRAVALLVAIRALASVSAAHAQNGRTTLVVGVGDVVTGAFLPSVQVRLKGIYANAFTDSMGRARLFRIEAGQYTIEVRRIGYEPLTAPVMVRNEDSLEVVMMMRATPQSLGAVTTEEERIPARLREFDERRRRGTGHYITEAQIEQLHGAPLNSVVMARIPGVRVRYDWLTGEEHVKDARGSTSYSGACEPAVLVDGSVLADGDIGFIDSSTIAGIEYYRPGTVPVQFQVSGVHADGVPANCGVMLIWTKR